MRQALLTLLVFFSFSLSCDAAALWRDQGKGVDASARGYQLDRAALDAELLLATATHPARIRLPMPDGSLRDFDAYAAPTMHAELAARYPQIRSYKAWAADGSADNARLTSVPAGIYAAVSDADGSVYIDPVVSAGTGTSYVAYRHGHKPGTDPTHRQMARCMLPATASANASSGRLALVSASASPAAKAVPQTAARTSGSLLKYRLAVAATVEYSAQVGGTVDSVLAEITRAIDRVNLIYENDVGITLELVADNDQIIFTAEPDGYTDDDLSIQLDQNQDKIDAIIGNANYDIGHVFSSTFGGLASLGVVCDNSSKARGATGRSGRTGDPFYVDLVAHELGHQFGANHSFNGTTGSCGFGRVTESAYEPGSGHTIMSYAGLCGTENISSNSIDSFHAGSIAEIVDFTRNAGGAACGVASGPATSAPVADAGADYTIPGGTPFVLTGSASDTDGDTLSYRWDEMGVQGQNSKATTSCSYGKDLGSNPLFKPLPASAEPQRILPNRANLFAGIRTDDEVLPLEGRVMEFRFTAFDGRGGVDEDDITVTVDNTKGPFVLLQPNGGESLDNGQTQSVEWHTACTPSAPVNCASVDIDISFDGGSSYSSVLAGTPNDGVELVNFSAFSGSGARLRIRCSDNIFFDVSDADFSVGPALSERLPFTGNGGTGSCGTTEVNNCGSLSGNDVEPNDSPAQAQAIIAPFSVTGVANDAADTEDWYSFVAASGAYSIVLNGFGLNDMDLYLVDSDGVTQLAASEAFDATTESIERSLNTGQTYYIQVVAFDTSGLDTNYSLALNRIVTNPRDLEPNDEFADVDDELFTIPFQLNGNVDDDDDPRDLFAFIGDSGSFNFILNNFGANNLDLRLYDSTRAQLAAAASATDSSELISYRLTEGEKYYVEVRATDTSNSASGYILTVARDGSGSGGGSSGLGPFTLTLLSVPWWLRRRSQRQRCSIQRL